MVNENKTELIILSAMVLLFIFIAHPFFSYGQVAGHSSYIDMIRHIVWHNQVIQGELFPRWIPDFYLGHGSPIFLFYAPASYVFLEFFRPFTNSPTMVLRLGYMVLIFISLLGMKQLGACLGGKWGGLAAAAVLGLAPYFLVDIYVRAGIAEFACFAILPWLFRSLILSGVNGKKGGLFLVAILLALLVTTHNITSMITAPFLFLFAVFVSKRKWLARTLGALVAGMGLSAWFWLPAIGEKNLVKSTESLTGGDYNFSNHFVFLKQLFVPYWGFGSSKVGPVDTISLQVGLTLLACVLSSLILAVLFFKKRKGLLTTERWKALVLFFVMFFVSLLFTNKATAIFWENLPLLSFVQFPWRFLLLATFAGAALTAYIPGWLEKYHSTKKLTIVLSIVIVIAAIITSHNYVKARYAIHDAKSNKILFASTREAMHKALAHPSAYLPEEILTLRNIRGMGATTTSKDDYLPKTVKNFGGKYHGFIAKSLDDNVRILEKSQRASTITLSIESDKGGKLLLEPFYFPGWIAKTGKRELKIEPAPVSGLISLFVPKGKWTVTVAFKDTPIRKVGKGISVLFAVGFALFIFFGKRREEELENES